MIEDSSEYRSDELDAMAHARNYFQWIISRWRPYLRGRVLEVGAGTGNFSKHLLAEAIDELVLIEPARNLFSRLSGRFANDPRVSVRLGQLQDHLPELRRTPANTAVTVNVLEHIRDDVEVLHGLREATQVGGTVLILVPALPVLYGPADENFGHVRRYTKRELAEKLRVAGLSVLDIRYFNFLGAFAWFTAGRVLRRRTVTTAMTQVSDRTTIPMTRGLERLVIPPFGQSVIAVAQH
jgi:SAM-dependent methyltransferase